jgi:hypothetical protein
LKVEKLHSRNEKESTVSGNSISESFIYPYR